MRPEIARYIINQTLDLWYYNEDENKSFEYPKDFLPAAERLLKKYRKELYDFFREDYPDLTDEDIEKRITLVESQVEEDSYGSWRTTMSYYSDRWQCFHRLYWIIYGIKTGRFI